MEEKVIYSVVLSSGRAVAAFGAMTAEEAADRAAVVAKALEVSGPWRVERGTKREPGVPWFEEDYFAMLALSQKKLS